MGEVGEVREVGEAGAASASAAEVGVAGARFSLLVDGGLGVRFSFLHASVYLRLALFDQSHPDGLCQRAMHVPGPGSSTSPFRVVCEVAGSRRVSLPFALRSSTENSRLAPSATVKENDSTHGSSTFTCRSKASPGATVCCRDIRYRGKPRRRGSQAICMHAGGGTRGFPTGAS